MKSILTGLSLLITLSYLYAADNYKMYGPRTIQLYDNVVTITKPTAVKDSVYHYWKYYRTMAGVYQVIDSADTAHSWITLINDSYFSTSNDTVTGDLAFGLAHARVPPTDTIHESVNYIVYGKVSNDANPILVVNLESAITRELVKSDTVTLGATFDPVNAGRTAALGLGSLYNTIIDFEKKQRAQGTLCAVAPKVTFSVGKKSLNDGESTTLTVNLNDCDGTALGNWPITLTTSAGTLNPAVVTTNAHGTATATFTASNIKTTALITTMLHYVQPTGSSAVASVLPVNISFNKPAEAWVASATYSYKSVSNSERTAPMETASSDLTTEIDIYFSAWVYNTSPVANTFVNDPNNYVIRKTASKSEESHSKQHFESDGSYIDEKGYYTTHAYDIKDSLPAPTVRVSDAGYTFGLKQIPASQTGDGESKDVTCLKTEGCSTSDEKYDVDPDIKLSFSITGKTKDTTYTVTEKSESGGLVTTQTTTVHQTCYWKNNNCWLTYERDFIEKTEFNMGFTEITTKTEHTTLNASAVPVDDNSGIVHRAEEFPRLNNLLPCQYNAASQLLNVHYSTGVSAQTTFKVIDLAGKEITQFTRYDKTAGNHRTAFKTSCLHEGFYILTMNSGSKNESRRFIVTR